jgi:uncharacterized protein YcbK (DUF882 family)
MSAFLIRLVETIMAGWLTSGSPVPAQAAGESEAANPVEVLLYDENAKEKATVWIHRDGTMDKANAAEVQRLFRCRRSHRVRKIAPGTLAMLADIAIRYPGRRIEYVSAYRATAEESRESPHRGGRAVDFRIRGISPIEIRDYLWSTYREVGVGWYPKEQYIHIDHRPGEKDIAWTFLRGKNVYNPSWSDRARSKVRPSRTPGV